MTNVEQLTGRFARIPKIEETGPQRGYNGKRATKLMTPQQARSEVFPHSRANWKRGVTG